MAMSRRNFTLSEGKCLTDNNYKIIAFEVRRAFVHFHSHELKILFGCQAKEENGGIFVKLPDPEAIDAVLGTRKWMVKQETREPMLSHHVEIVAPQADTEKPALMQENLVQSCMAGNKNLDW